MKQNPQKKPGRKPRTRDLRPGATYHVSCKINRDEIIFDDDAISVLLLDVIIRCKKRHSFTIKNFCIMGNHVHFIITPGKNSPLPRIMQWINNVFARAYNAVMGISGRLWKERYHSVVIETAEQFIATFKYIVKNPLKAGLSRAARSWRFSGLYHYLHGIKAIITAECPAIQLLYEECKSMELLMT